MVFFGPEGRIQKSIFGAESYRDTFRSENRFLGRKSTIIGARSSWLHAKCGLAYSVCGHGGSHTNCIAIRKEWGGLFRPAPPLSVLATLFVNSLPPPSPPPPNCAILSSHDFKHLRLYPARLRRRPQIRALRRHRYRSTLFTKHVAEAPTCYNVGQSRRTLHTTRHVGTHTQTIHNLERRDSRSDD